MHLIGEANRVHSICHFLPWCVSCGLSVIVLLCNVFLYNHLYHSKLLLELLILWPFLWTYVQGSEAESHQVIFLYFLLYIGSLWDSVKRVLSSEFTSDAQLSGIWHHEGTSFCDYPNCVTVSLCARSSYRIFSWNTQGALTWSGNNNGVGSR